MMRQDLFSNGSLYFEQKFEDCLQVSRLLFCCVVSQKILNFPSSAQGGTSTLNQNLHKIPPLHTIIQFVLKKQIISKPVQITTLRIQGICTVWFWGMQISRCRAESSEIEQRIYIEIEYRIKNTGWEGSHELLKPLQRHSLFLHYFSITGHQCQLLRFVMERVLG